MKKLPYCLPSHIIPHLYATYIYLTPDIKEYLIVGPEQTSLSTTCNETSKPKHIVMEKATAATKETIDKIKS